MSDILLASGVPITSSQVQNALRFTQASRTMASEEAGFIWGVSRVDGFSLWGPAYHPESQTRVLIGGRIALDEAQWAAAERSPFEGGLAARHILSQWLDGGAAGVEEYNGAATIVIIDGRRGEAHVWTGRMGFYPTFADSSNGTIIASHPDVIAALAAASGRAPALDELTIAQVLRTGAGTHPHTYWRSVKHLDAATRFHVAQNPRPALRAEGVYWTPAYVRGARSLSRPEFVEAFSAALRASGRRRSSSRFGRTVVLLSAGADSRGVLSAARASADVTCCTYYDEPREEYESARRIAALAGADFVGLQRHPDYYVANAEETVRLTGGLWSAESGHHTGFVSTLRDQLNPGVVLTGCYCDYLFKGLAIDSAPHTLFGRDLPLYRPHKFNSVFHLPHGPISPVWSERVEERLLERFPVALQNADDKRLVEYARVSPIALEGDASSRLTLWRTTPFDVFVADNDILDVYGRQSVADKMSGIAFGQAVARVTGPEIAGVPNNNFGAPVGTTELGRVVSFLRASAARKISGAFAGPPPKRSDSVATTGSWPNLTKVALKSALMRGWFEASKRRGLLFDMLAPERRDLSYEQFAALDTFQLYRLVTLELWLRNNLLQQPAGHASSAAIELNT